MLKILAMLFMVIDHTALALFQNDSTLYLIARLIGRLSMPIFAYKIACGFIYTRNLKSYAYKIFLMTLAAQIPFLFLTSGDRFFSLLKETNGLMLINHWNIGLTFLCALGILHLITSRTHENRFKSSILIVLLLLLSSFADYGIYGVCIVLLFYIFIKRKSGILISMMYLATLTICYYLIMMPGVATYMVSMQLPAILAIPLIHYIPDNKTKLHKHFFYIFYPVHMLIIGFISYYLQ